MTPADIADRLQSVVDDLDEMSFDMLRAAAAEGATRRPDTDKELARARRAVERAIAVLRLIEEH